MSKPPFPARPGNRISDRSLKTYDHRVQQYGTLFSSFPWQAYCTGTYRSRKSLMAAQETFRKFIRILEKKLKCPLAHLQVAERTTSGLGKPPGAWHWHFVLCGPGHRKADVVFNAASLWNQLNGNAHVRPYNRKLNGARYLAKTAKQIDFDYSFANFERLTMPTSLDLFEHQQMDPYVPENVRHLLTGETLVTRE